eukprot:scaffold126_cov315-Pavlova_lutheri.AAC.38
MPSPRFLQDRHRLPCPSHRGCREGRDDGRRAWDPDCISESPQIPALSLIKFAAFAWTRVGGIAAAFGHGLPRSLPPTCLWKARPSIATGAGRHRMDCRGQPVPWIVLACPLWAGFPLIPRPKPTNDGCRVRAWHPSAQWSSPPRFLAWVGIA